MSPLASLFSKFVHFLEIYSTFCKHIIIFPYYFTTFCFYMLNSYSTQQDTIISFIVITFLLLYYMQK
mgnify:CR=1 FL=1